MLIPTLTKSMNGNMKEKINTWIISVIMLMLSILMIAPFIFMVLGSLKTMGEIQSPTFSLLPEAFRWINYAEAMQRGNWLTYIKNSVIVTVVATVISLIINSLCGYAFARLEFKGRDTLFSLALLGLLVPPQVTIVPVFVMMSKIPLAGGNNIFGQGGIGWINSYWGLIVPYLAGSFGVFLCRQFYISFPKSLDEAAKIDGCSKWRTYFMIYLPLSKSILATLAILKASFCWNEYTWPLIITNSEKMRTVQLALAVFKSENTVEWNLLLAASTTISIPMILMFLMGQKYYVEGIVTSGIKG